MNFSPKLGIFFAFFGLAILLPVPFNAAPSLVSGLSPTIAGVIGAYTFKQMLKPKPNMVPKKGATEGGGMLFLAEHDSGQKTQMEFKDVPPSQSNSLRGAAGTNPILGNLQKALVGHAQRIRKPPRMIVTGPHLEGQFEGPNSEGKADKGPAKHLGENKKWRNGEVMKVMDGMGWGVE